MLGHISSLVSSGIILLPMSLESCFFVARCWAPSGCLSTHALISSTTTSSELRDAYLHLSSLVLFQRRRTGVLRRESGERLRRGEGLRRRSGVKSLAVCADAL